MLINFPCEARFSLPSSTNGFKPAHIYNITVTDDEYNGSGYIVTSDYDVTEYRGVDITIRLSSMQSVDRYFKNIIK